MIRNIYYMMKYRKGDITWTHIISAIIALLVLALMLYVSIKNKSSMDKTHRSFLDFL